MDARKVIKHLSEITRISMRSASIKMGKHPRYLGSTVYCNAAPSANSLAQIGEQFGYDLYLVPKDKGWVPRGSIQIYPEE